MTEKQENILKSALHLFAKEGYHATSTSKVAREAGVSEGLIFRHFGNKEGLMQAILQVGENRIKALFVDIIMETDPKILIRKTIMMTSLVDKEDYEFWKLQYKLKWELEISSDKKMEPLEIALANAFRKLGYLNPSSEAKLLIILIEGLSSAVLKGSNIKLKEMTEFLINKYKLD